MPPEDYGFTGPRGYNALPTASELAGRYTKSSGPSKPVDVTKLPPLPETDYDPVQLSRLSQMERSAKLELIVLELQDENRRLKSENASLQAELEAATIFG